MTDAGGVARAIENAVFSNSKKSHMSVAEGTHFAEGGEWKSKARNPTVPSNFKSVEFLI
jgi:hypothetical protein